MSQLMNDIQPYIGTIVIAIVGGVTTMVGVAIKVLTSRAVTLIESKLTVDQQVMLNEAGKEAFAHAETVFKGMGGPAKLQAATDYASKKLNSLGIIVPAEELQATVHSAWIDNKAKVNPKSLAESTTSSDMKIM